MILDPEVLEEAPRVFTSKSVVVQTDARRSERRASIDETVGSAQGESQGLSWPPGDQLANAAIG